MSTRNFADYIKLKYIGAGIIFLTPKSEILLLQKENKKWTFPGGHRQDKEFSPLDTAERECKEELGLMPAGKIIGKLKFIRRNEELPIYSFLMTVKNSFIPHLSNEHIDYKWINYKKVKPENLSCAFKNYWDIYKKFISRHP